MGHEHRNDQGEDAFAVGRPRSAARPQPQQGNCHFAAARVCIENWRWQGVPIYVRTGKALRRSVTEGVIRFKDAPHLELDGRPVPYIPALLVIRFQPGEEVVLRIGAKVPGGRFELEPAGLSLDYNSLARGPLPDAYENQSPEPGDDCSPDGV